MKEIRLEHPRELDVLIIGLYSKPIKGLEQMRLFGKVLDALEHIAVLSFDEDGNVLALKRKEDGSLELDQKGKPVRVTYLKEVPCVLRIDDAYWQFLKARILDFDWSPQMGRVVLELLTRAGETEAENAA